MSTTPVTAVVPALTTLNTYGIIIVDAASVRHQLTVQATTWANALVAAKNQVGLDGGPETDVNLRQVTLLQGVTFITGK